METDTNPQSPPAGDRPLRRSVEDRVIAGVAGGIARRLDIPAWVVRVAFVVLSFGGGLGVALYIAGWLLIPDDHDAEPLARGFIGRVSDRSGWIGIAFVGLGVLIAASSIDFIRADLALAVFIAVIGVMLYRGEFGSPGPDSEPTDPVAARPTTSPAQPATASGFTAETGTTVAPPPTTPPPAPPEAAEPPRPPKPPKPPSVLGRLTIALSLIATGVMAFLDYVLTAFDPTPRHYLGLALAILATGLLVGSLVGRARGLIFVGILLIPFLIFSPIAEFDFRGDSSVGQRRVVVDSADEIAGPYDLAMGELVIDLRSVDFTGEVVDLAASVGIGSLRVLVPDGVEVELAAQVGIGEVQAFGSSRSGFAREIETARSGNAGRLVLDAEAFIGEVRVSGNGGPAIAADFDEHVVTPSQLQDVYDFQTGDVRLDLSDLVLRSPRTVRIENGVGRIEVIVASAATTNVTAHTDIGQVVVFGQSSGGFDTTVDHRATGAAILTLEIDLDAGEIVVVEEN